MAQRDAIVRYLDETLEADQYRDHLPLGLQVPGAREVSHVCTAVSASLDVFERAADAGAQMLIVHHGLFWDGSPRRIGMLERRRLETLFRNDLSLVAYHLPLDGHHELGNNAVLAQLIGLQGVAPFGEYRGRLLGRHGTLPAPQPAVDMAMRLGAMLGSRPQVFAGAPDPVQRIGIISGAAAREIGEAADLGLDCFITGEPEEDSPYLAAELGVTLIAAGHNATETVGVRAVGDRLAEVFGVTTTFIGVENPV